MYGENLTPLRSMAAYAHLPEILAHKRYIGDLKLPGAVRSRVFSDGRETVACIYVPLQAALQTERAAVDPFYPPHRQPGGNRQRLRRREIPAAAHVRLDVERVEDGVVFLFLDGEPERFLNRETDAMRVYRVAENYRFDANQAWRGGSIQFGLQARDGKTPAPRLKFYDFCAASCAAGDTVYRNEPANVCKESLRGKIAFRFSRSGSASLCWSTAVRPAAGTAT
ncbi:MAG: hypothetical protein HPZ91_09185 [Lentisphaeria bacterium]|nr:hypothetical protein [Lentisphaeria bacterium]